MNEASQTCATARRAPRRFAAPGPVRAPTAAASRGTNGASRPRTVRRARHRRRTAFDALGAHRGARLLGARSPLETCPQLAALRAQLPSGHTRMVRPTRGKGSVWLCGCLASITISSGADEGRRAAAQQQKASQRGSAAAEGNGGGHDEGMAAGHAHEGAACFAGRAAQAAAARRGHHGRGPVRRARRGARGGCTGHECINAFLV